MTAENFWEMIMTVPLQRILEQYPVCRDFFLNLRIDSIDWSLTLVRALDQTDEEVISEFGLDRGMIMREFCQFLETFARDTGQKTEIRSITIIGGHDKSGQKEISLWTAAVGDVISIVGPTGAGKSRLLADIECLADCDTPSGRKILVDGRQLSDEERFSMEGRLIAQLSQNMNFVMDLTVHEFLTMHSVSRMTRDAENTIKRCFECANELAGEKFGLGTKVTQLSGGQSRALMIADTACMSSSPIVLIDEIENAGIDRRQAIKLLAREEKIVFISTHDPLLALSADKRVVIKNGGVNKIITTSDDEKNCLDTIEQIDATVSALRNSLRNGNEITMKAMKGMTQ